MRFPRAENRNPYPIPNISSEGFWIKNGPILGGNVLATDRSWATRLSVSDRLFAHHTLNSIRRDQRFIRNMVPNDGLDFALSSIYIHSEDFMVPKRYVPMQPETINLKTWRVLRNELPLFETLTVRNKGERNSTRKNVLKIKTNTSVLYAKTAIKSYDNKSANRGQMSANKKYVEQSETSKRSKTSPLSSSRRDKTPDRNYGKTLVPSSTREQNIVKNYGRTSLLTKEHNKISPSRGHKKISSSFKEASKRYETDSPGRSKTAANRVVTSNQEYGKTLTRSKHKTTSGISREPIGDDVLDKEHRRKTYAAQMLPIERVHPSSLKLVVDGPHSDQTNPGYSRKIDGTFYGI